MGGSGGVVGLGCRLDSVDLSMAGRAVMACLEIRYLGPGYRTPHGHDFSVTL